MIELTLNGEPVSVPAGTTVADLVAARLSTQKGVAVAVDRTVVPRSAWSSTTLGPGAEVELVGAVAGG
jgi:sulfur carrier protein